MPNEPHPRSAWVEIGKQVISFVVGIVVAAFILGRNSQRINDVVTWKAQIAPIIERMDSKGTLSFAHFKESYDKDQHRTDDHLKELEKEVKQIQKDIDP